MQFWYFLNFIELNSGLLFFSWLIWLELDIGYILGLR